VCLRPLVMGIKILLQPRISYRDAVLYGTTVHVVIQIRDDEGDCQQPTVVSGKVSKTQIRRAVDRRPVPNTGKVDPWNMFVALNAAVVATWRGDIDLGTDRRQ